MTNPRFYYPNLIDTPVQYFEKVFLATSGGTVFTDVTEKVRQDDTFVITTGTASGDSLYFFSTSPFSCISLYTNTLAAPLSLSNIAIQILNNTTWTSLNHSRSRAYITFTDAMLCRFDELPVLVPTRLEGLQAYVKK